MRSASSRVMVPARFIGIDMSKLTALSSGGGALAQRVFDQLTPGLLPDSFSWPKTLNDRIEEWEKDFRNSITWRFSKQRHLLLGQLFGLVFEAVALQQGLGVSALPPEFEVRQDYVWLDFDDFPVPALASIRYIADIIERFPNKGIYAIVKRRTCQPSEATIATIVGDMNFRVCTLKHPGVPSYS